MNVMLYEESEILSGNRLRIVGRRADHLKNVLGAVPGKLIKVGQINRGFSFAEIKEVSDSYLELSLVNDLTPQEDNVFSRVSILLCLPRPQSFKKVLELVGTLGIKSLTLIDSARVEKSYFNSPVFLEENIREHLLLGMEQGEVVNLPKVTVLKGAKISQVGSQVEKSSASLSLQELLSQEAACFLAHPSSSESLSSLYKSGNDLYSKQFFGKNILLAIGPEGGWVDFELEVFKKYNFNFINLGNRILRVETAITFVLAQLAIVAELTD